MLWAGDQRTKLLANVEAYGGSVAMITATAPGRELLGHGDDGQVLDVDRLRWNGQAPANWRTLHRAAAQVARRRHGVLSMLARTWEYQQRGVLHVHVVLGTQTAAERAAAHTYAITLDRLRSAHRFGFVSDAGRGGGKWRARGLETVPSSRAARYVAKYLSPLDAHGKPTLSETVLQPDVPRQVAYVSTRLTARTGVTMRNLRLRRRVYVLSRNGDAQTIIELLAAHPTLPACLGHYVPDTRGP